jgi:hypothetical protein
MTVKGFLDRQLMKNLQLDVSYHKYLPIAGLLHRKCGAHGFMEINRRSPPLGQNLCTRKMIRLRVLLKNVCQLKFMFGEIVKVRPDIQLRLNQAATPVCVHPRM